MLPFLSSYLRLNDTRVMQEESAPPLKMLLLRVPLKLPRPAPGRQRAGLVRRWVSRSPITSSVTYSRHLKTNLSAKTFKSQAHPLHISITHIPPPPAEESGEKVQGESPDPGFVAALSLGPSSFSTGTYGWKGSKRITIEVLNPDTGEKEKLQVQLRYVARFPHVPGTCSHVLPSFNATVLGSKGKDEEGEETKEEEEKKEERGEEKTEEEKEEKEDVQEE